MLNRVSLRQMEYFVATAKHVSIAAASAQIHISSPSISAAIAHIETELGVQLFVRHPSKGLGLTAIGTLVLSWLSVQSLFTLHYAHRYFGDPDDNGKTQEGFQITGDPAADKVLDDSAFALLIGMMLDQHMR